MKPILSIIVIEYKCIEEVNRCISSIQTNITVPHEVIVSSNSCYTEADKKTIQTPSDNVRWNFNPENGGFAYAMNQGLKRAVGKYFIIMNSDCTFRSDIQNMVQFMDNHPEIGAIAPQMRDEEGNLQDTARPYVSLPSFIWRQVKRVLKHEVSILTPNMDYNRIQTVDWVIGAFIMVSRKAYEATKGLDESYFMYAEDLDWCTRIRKEGLEIVYFPKVQIEYKGTRRARTNSLYAKIFFHSHMHYWKKFGFCFGYPKRKKWFFD